MKSQYFEDLVRGVCHCGIESETLEATLIRIMKEARQNGDDKIADFIFREQNGRRSFQYVTNKTDNYGGYEFMYGVQKPVTNLIVPDNLREKINSLISALKKDKGINRIFFTGKSGTGKTEMANFIAKELLLDSFVINCISLVNSHLGETPKNILKVFETMKHSDKKTIYFFDELDSIVNNRSNYKDLEEMARAVTAFMRGLDMVESNNNVVIIAATNLDKNVDPAVIRRFDISINFDVYDEEILNKIGNAYFNEFDSRKDGNFDFASTFKPIIHDFLERGCVLSPANIKQVIKVAICFAPESCGAIEYKSYLTGCITDTLREMVCK